MKRIFSMPLRHLALFLAVPLAIGMSISIRCEADWINNNTSGGQPFDAILGGIFNGGVVYVCRAYHNGDVQPGYAARGEAVCHFSYGGSELTSANFDWYVPSWWYSYGQAMPGNAIPLGAEPEVGGIDYRYPCRVNLTPGKYGQDLSACYFPYGGLENHMPNSGFSWLIDPNNNINPPTALLLEQNLVGDIEDIVIGPYMLIDMGAGSEEVWPDDAVVAGLDVDGTPLYFCTAFFQDGMQPGKARQDWNACDVSWGGSEHYIGPSGHFHLLEPAYLTPLSGNNWCWPSSGPCSATPNPMPVGTDTDGSTLYSCQVWTEDNQFIPGKTKASMNGSCSYARNGVEIYAPADDTRVLSDGVTPH